MKVKLFLTLIIAALALTSGKAQATVGGPYIQIDDSLDGPPVVQTDPDTGWQYTTGFEQATITGTLSAGAVAITTGTRSVILTEPASDPFGPRQSDFLTLTVEEAQIGAVAYTITVFFQSDGALGFDDNIAALLRDETPSTPETGDWQDLSELLNSPAGFLDISVMSDLNSPEPIPEPSTLLLLGAGLAGVGLMRRRFKK